MSQEKEQKDSVKELQSPMGKQVESGVNIFQDFKSYQRE